MPAAQSPGLADLERRFASMLTDLGLTSNAVEAGTSYKHGRLTLCRVDPKPTKRIVRVEVGAEAEEKAPEALVGVAYRQKGWLAISPEHAEAGLRYVEQCVRKRLAALRR